MRLNLDKVINLYFYTNFIIACMMLHGHCCCKLPIRFNLWVDQHCHHCHHHSHPTCMVTFHIIPRQSLRYTKRIRQLASSPCLSNHPFFPWALLLMLLLFSGWLVSPYWWSLFCNFVLLALHIESWVNNLYVLGVRSQHRAWDMVDFG